MFTVEFLNKFKREESRGRCLHYDNGERCNEIINAHSIQKSKQLGKIIENGHVYRITPDISSVHEKNGQLIPKKIGWNKASTFAGFCKHHDNQLFKPIDDFPLEPNREQVALYAYRCLCREYFKKENVTNTLLEFHNSPEQPLAIKDFLYSLLIGNELGFHRLKHHKQYFDAALSSKNYNEFEFTTFTSNSPWNLQLSGVLYPDYDFQGQQIQDLSDKSALDFISFFTAPTLDGWSLTLCWHVSSHTTCEAFTQSLAEAMNNGTKLEDALFRFSFSCCENHAFRISWWDKLPTLAKKIILERIDSMAAPDIPVSPNYLSQGLEAIADWKFDNVYTTLTIQE